MPLWGDRDSRAASALMSELVVLRGEARRLARRGLPVPSSLLERLGEATEVERLRVRAHRRARRLGAAPVVREARVVLVAPEAFLGLPLASRQRGAERRVRVFERSCGWRFVFEVLEESGWRVVQEREPGSRWSCEEALHRARVYADMQMTEVYR